MIHGRLITVKVTRDVPTECNSIAVKADRRSHAIWLLQDVVVERIYMYMYSTSMRGFRVADELCVGTGQLES